MSSYDFDDPRVFTAGAVGEPGQRLFLVQVAQGTRMLTLKVEKQQVAVLAEYVSGIVRAGPRPGHVDEPADLTPENPDWTVGTIGVSYDEDLDRVVIVASELVVRDEGEGEPASEDEGPEGDLARIAITREQAAGFSMTASRLVASGRPACPICGGPMDPGGHLCPRTNGHRPPIT